MEDIGEKCAVFGIYGKGMDVSRLSFFGLYALQHRGQESAGIATSDGESMCVYKGMGLVSQVFSEEKIQALPGHISIGHNRYSTAGGSHVKHAQPMLGAGMKGVEKTSYGDDKSKAPLMLCSMPNDGAISLVHNGNLPTTDLLHQYLIAAGIDDEDFSDSRMIVESIAAQMRTGDDLEQAVRSIYPLMTGAFSILLMSNDKLIAIRDRCGIRPLSYGTLNGGHVFSSETCAFHPVGATFVRDVAPGEMMVVDSEGMRFEQLTPADPKFDVFEFVYFSRPDSELLGRSVYEVRKQFGVELAREFTATVDVVIPVPETAIPVAIGYAQGSRVPFELGLAKNRYIHRTFIQPEQHIREQGVRAKLTPIPQVIRGKRVAVIDDSIVRGTTSQQIVKMLYDAGAAEVHFLVSSPPVKYPDFYGIDTPRQKDLISANRSVEETRAFLGATSLHFLSYDALIRAIGLPEDILCTSCFTGDYPIDIGTRANEITKV